MKTNKKPPDSLLLQIRKNFEPHSTSPYLDALVLLSHISAQPKSRVLANPSPNLTPEQQTELSLALNQVKGGIPLPYILGAWEFYQLSFHLTADVLIPRPETEGLIEKALKWLQDHPGRRTCLDLGTGSGCIAVTLAAKIPDLKLLATDRSYPATLVARKNAQNHKIDERINFLTCDLLTGFRTTVDLLIANLPYIPTEKLKSLRVYNTEPRLALDGGADGLASIRDVLEKAPGIMNPGGLILLEIDESKGDEAQKLTQSIFPRAEIKLEKDLSGMDRYLSIHIK
ncbi:MAG: peptide chain release factor N(5)-glutamine methyltransferase [Anaerolineales bacterium]|nr:peptide chain release factor N(5)-glutamine methyltransferase [Anaerolineales bacterium]